MKVGIIGAGNVGGALASSSVRAGHTVTISSKTFEHAQRTAQTAGATAVRSNREAVEGADLIILAVPYAAVESIVKEAGRALNGKILIDVTNRFRQDNPGLALDGSSNAEAIAAMARGTKVVKAFNTVLAFRQAAPAVEGIELDGLVAGDDTGAKQTVLDYIRSLGFRPIDAGSLAMSRALEGMALLNIMLNARNGWTWQTGWKLLGPTGGSPQPPRR